MEVSKPEIVKLIVADLDASLTFYEALFGLKEQYRVSDHLAGEPFTEIALGPFQAGDARLVLLRFDDAKPARCGGAIIVFRVADIEAVLLDVSSSGGTILEPGRVVPDFKVKVAFLRDPDGHLVEITSPLTT